MRHVIMVGPNYRRARKTVISFGKKLKLSIAYLGLAGPGERCLLGVAPLRSHNAQEGEANSQEAYDNFRS